MPDLIDFDEALERTDGEDRALLIGNGFSAEYFSYRNLLDKSGLVSGTPIRGPFRCPGHRLFRGGGSVTRRCCFGRARIWARCPRGRDRGRCAKGAEVLVAAVNSTHPAHREDLVVKYPSSSAFLSHFQTVFSLNYDLLLYWVNLEKSVLKDGFGLGKTDGSFHGPFKEGAHCQIYSLHGGLHLFEDEVGDIHKAIDRGSGVIATITDTIAEGRRFPWLYVAEGSSAQKMRRIVNSIAYLRHCYDMLVLNPATVFVYGHSADENDAHIYRAIFGSSVKQMYFGVYKPNETTLKELDGLLAKYQRTSGSSTDYTFFDSESAKIWV